MIPPRCPLASSDPSHYSFVFCNIPGGSDKWLIFVEHSRWEVLVENRSFVFNNIPGDTCIFAIVFPLLDRLHLKLLSGLVSLIWCLDAAIEIPSILF